jgi:ABC-2 type transport system permease protein
MRSKNSFFNKTIFKKNVTLYWPLWILYLGFLLLVMPGVIWMEMSRYNKLEAMDLDMAAIQLRTLQGSISIGISPIIIFACAVVMAMAVFSYLNVARTANAIHALPVSRTELFVTNYLSGLSFMIIPQIITFLVTVVVCLSFEVTSIQYLLEWLLMTMGMTFFAYSMAVFVEMFTGQTFAMPVYFFIVNFLYVGIRSIIDSLVMMLCYGVTDYSSLGTSCVLSPLYYLATHVKASLIYSDEYVNNYYSSYVTGISITGQGLVALYALAAIVLVAAAFALYRKRKIETAGDLITIAVVKPIFRWGFGICCGFVSAMLALVILWDYDLALSRIWTYIAVIFCGFIFFVIAQMMLEKRFKVIRKPLLKEWLIFAVASVVVLGLVDFDVFGIESYVPDTDEIEAAFVYMDYPLEVAGEDYDALIEAHREIIADCDEMRMAEHSGEYHYYYTTIRYYLKSGKEVSRSYALPLAEDISDGSPAGTFLYWESEPENLKKDIFGVDVENTDYHSAVIDLVNDAGESQDYAFTEEESKRLYDAAMRDLEEGHFTNYFTYLDRDDSYYNSLQFYYKTPHSNNDVWYYYEYYFEAVGSEYADGTMTEIVESDWVADDTGVIYITFGPQCTNILDVLNDIGVESDEWKLMTQTQMSEIWN